MSVIHEWMLTSSASVQSLLLRSVAQVLTDVDDQPWDDRRAECLQTLTEALIIQIRAGAEEICLQSLSTCIYHPDPPFTLIELLAMLLDQADPTRHRYIAALTLAIGRLAYKLKTTLIDLAPLQQEANLPSLFTKARQKVAAGDMSNVEELGSQLYTDLPNGPKDIARSLVRLIAKPTDDLLAVIAQLESLLSGDAPLSFQQEERALLAHLEEQVSALFNHSAHEVQIMAGAAVVRLLLPDEKHFHLG
jgi:hypothetical protein